MSAMSVGGLAIGVDVGGTKTAVGLVDLTSGQVLASREIPSEAHFGADALHERLGPAVAQLRADRDVVSAVAVPELVSPDGLVITDVVIPGLVGDLTSTWADLGVVAVESDMGRRLAEALVKAVKTELEPGNQRSN
jgi:glucokinase